MQPGADRLPEWVQAIAGLLLLAIIMFGGWWLQTKEKKDRALEKERRDAKPPLDNPEA
jgi:hypothetical protein